MKKPEFIQDYLEAFSSVRERQKDIEYQIKEGEAAITAGRPRAELLKIFRTIQKDINGLGEMAGLMELELLANDKQLAKNAKKRNLQNR